MRSASIGKLEFHLGLKRQTEARSWRAWWTIKLDLILKFLKVVTYCIYILFGKKERERSRERAEKEREFPYCLQWSNLERMRERDWERERKISLMPAVPWLGPGQGQEMGPQLRSHVGNKEPTTWTVTAASSQGLDWQEAGIGSKVKLSLWDSGMGCGCQSVSSLLDQKPSCALKCFKLILLIWEAEREREEEEGRRGGETERERGKERENTNLRFREGTWAAEGNGDQKRMN